jgi:hypothetical protein
VYKYVCELRVCEYACEYVYELRVCEYGLCIKRACLSRVVCSSFLSHATSCLYYESTASQSPSSPLSSVRRLLIQRSLASVLCSAFARLAFPRPRGTCLSGRVPSSPWHLSKWSYALVPAALVQVVVRPHPRGTCPSGRTPLSPQHLSKWSYALVPATLV